MSCLELDYENFLNTLIFYYFIAYKNITLYLMCSIKWTKSNLP